MAANPIHVDHVRRHLDDAFGEHIYIDDIKKQPEEKLQEARRSRALAALAVQYLTKCSESDAALSVIDGKDDNGIDAIAWDLDSAHLYLVQAKWSEQGKAGPPRTRVERSPVGPGSTDAADLCCSAGDLLYECDGKRLSLLARCPISRRSRLRIAWPPRGLTGRPSPPSRSTAR